jgi:uncharacterized protein (TIGR02246 family)
MGISDQDRHDIEEVVADSERFQSDPEAFSQLPTQEVTLINVVGARLTGRDTVRRAMEEAMKTSLANVHTTNEIERVTFLRPDLAVMTGNKHVLVERNGTENRSLRPVSPSCLSRRRGRGSLRSFRTHHSTSETDRVGSLGRLQPMPATSSVTWAMSPSRAIRSASVSSTACASCSDVVALTPSFMRTASSAR